MGVTLAKDVPFAAAYWSVLEPLRSTMLPEDPSASPAQVQPHLHTQYCYSGDAAFWGALSLSIAVLEVQSAAH